MGMRPHFTPAEDVELRKEYETGQTIRELAVKYGTNTSNVHTALQRAGADMRARAPRVGVRTVDALTVHDILAMATQRASGVAVTKVARDHHVRVDVVKMAERVAGDLEEVARAQGVRLSCSACGSDEIVAEPIAEPTS